MLVVLTFLNHKTKCIYYICAYAQSLNSVLLFRTPWTIAHQAPLSMGLSLQEYWSGLPFPTPGDLPNPGMEPTSPVSPTLAGGWILCHCATWEAHILYIQYDYFCKYT